MGGIIVDLVLLIIIIGNIVIGYKEGLVKILFNMFSSIIAIVFVFILYKPTTNFIMTYTHIPNSVEAAISDKVEILLNNGVEAQTNKASDNNTIMGILKSYTGDKIGNAIEQTTSNIAKTVSHEVTYKIISIFSFIILFAVIRLFLFALRNYIVWVAELPLINILNGFGGIIYGVIKGVLLVYVGLAVASLLLPIYGDTSIILAIRASHLGSIMFDNNIILNLIFKYV